MFDGPIRDSTTREQVERILDQLRDLAKTWEYLRASAEKDGKTDQAASCMVQIARIERQCEFLDAALRKPVDPSPGANDGSGLPPVRQ